MGFIIFGFWAVFWRRIPHGWIADGVFRWHIPEGTERHHPVAWIGCHSERSELSPDMAARLEKAFGLDMGLLLRMQLAHTEAIKRQHWDEIDVERFALG